MPKLTPVEFDPFAGAGQAALTPVDYDPFAAGDQASQQAAFRSQHAADVPLPSGLVTPMPSAREVALGDRLTALSTGAGHALTGSLEQVPHAMAFAAGGVNHALGLGDQADQDFALADTIQRKAEQSQRIANEASPVGSVAGNILGIVPKMVAPEALALDALSHGTDLGARAVQAGHSVPSATALLGEGVAAGMAQNLVPGHVNGNLVTRLLTGAGINGGMAVGEQALEHATAPDVVQAPTLESVSVPTALGAILAATLGHGARVPHPEERLAADPEWPGLPEPQGQTKRPTGASSPGPVRVTPQGEAFTPAQGKQVLAEAIGQALHGAPVGLPEPTIAVDRQGVAKTTADQHAALSQPKPEDLATALGLTPGTLAAQAKDARTAREGAPIPPKGLPAPSIAVDKAGTAMTSDDFMQQLRERQAAREERQALGITPDIERSQGVRWAKQRQAAETEAERQNRLKALDGEIVAREAQNTPARGRTARPDESVDDALTFLAKQGGLERRAFVQQGLDPVLAKARENLTRGGASRPLFRAQGNGGMSLDDAARTLWQHGYLPEQDNQAALDLILSGVNQGTPAYSIHRAAQDDLMQLKQARQDAEQHTVDTFDDVPFSRKVPDSTDSSGTPAGWVVRNKTTGEPVLETRQRSVAEKVNTDKYEVVPVGRHLAELNDPASLAGRHMRRAASKAEPSFSFASERAHANNASGESSASLEAISRLRDEKAAGQHRMLIDRDGSVRPLTGVDAVDTHARAGQVIVQRGVGREPWTVLSADPALGRDAVAGKVNAARGKLDAVPAHAANDAEPPAGEYDLPGFEDEEPAHAHDAAAVERYNARLSDYLGADVHLTPAADVPDAARRALAAFDDAFGGRTIVVRNDTPDTLDFNGVTLRDGMRLVNEDATSPLLTVAGHEMLHQLRKDAPDLYRELVAEVRRQGRLDSYEAVLTDRARAAGEQGKTFRRDEVEEELTADATGDALSDPDFIDRLAKRNPSLFRRVADRLREFFDALAQRLRRSLGSSPFLADVEAFRTKLADVLERYATRQQGEPVTRGAREATEPAYQRVFHGTPHTVDKFSLQKIGTGEGAQAYGWGLYFAGKRDVALHYRDRLTDATAPVSTMTVRGERVDPDSPEGHGARLIAHNGKAEMKQLAKQMLADAKAGEPYTIETAQRQGMDPVEYYQRVADTIASVNKRDVTVNRGNVYKVEIPEDHDLLDNDTRIGDQNAKVQEVARALLREEGYLREGENGPRQLASAFRSMGLERGGMVRGPDGQLLYTMLAKKLGSEQAASQYLNEHGIPGLRYKAGQIAGVRNAGTNYVIWDEGAIGAPEHALSRKPVDDQTQTPAFRKWFGSSKVVDAEGRPLVVYHGTSSDVPVFRHSRFGHHYFTDDPAAASVYADVASPHDANGYMESGENGIGPNVMPVYLSIKNPLVLDGKWQRENMDDGGEWNWEILDQELYMAEGEGHDGAILRGFMDYSGSVKGEGRKERPYNQYVAFKPEQIKSATGNRGTFDSEEPSILFSRKPSPGSTTPADMPSRRPGESQGAYARRVMRKSADQIKAATALAKRQKTINRQLLRAKLAGEARALATADAALAEARKTFDKTPDVINYASVHQFETGQPIADADFRAFAATMQEGFDQRIAEIRRLAPDALASLIEHYMPHLYEDSGRAIKWYQGVLGKRPMEGDKSFLKQRTWPTLKEAMASGLKPISPNPVDWVLMKYHQMDKFIGMLRYREELKQRGWILKMEPGQRPPEGWGRVDNPAFQIAGGLQGYYAVPEGMARDINTLLAPGLERYGAWRTFRSAQNALVSANLGFSAFHASFTSTDNVVTHFGVGLNRLAMGDLAGGARHILEAIPTIVTGPFHGAKLNRQWLGQEAVDPHTAALLDLLEQGGARYKNSPELVSYNNALPVIARGLRRMQAPGYLPDRADDLRRQLALDGPLATGGKVVWEGAKGIGRAFSAVGEVGSYAIHHLLVPNQKMAARITLLKMELDRYAEKLGKRRGDYAGIVQVMNPDVARQLASEVVDRVDFRLGQMIYDNFFVPKITRQVAQALLLAPGWLVGGVQTAVGGVRDLPRLVKPAKLVGPLDKAGTITDAHRGRIGNNLTSLAALFLLVGGANAIFQYLMTGEGPRELRDLVAPRTGRKNADDTDERITSPNYLKDHYELVAHPIATLGHKLNPSLRMLWDLAHNRDYFGNKIRNEKDPLGAQAEQIASYILKGMLPLSVQNLAEAKANGDGPGTMAAGFFGFNPAPGSLNRSAFQAFVAKGGDKGWDYPAATPQEAAYNAKLRDAENALRTGQPPDLTGITPRDVARLQRKVRTPKPEAQFNRLAIEDMLDAYDLATPAERSRYRLREAILHHHPARSAAFRRLSETEQQAVLDRIAKLRE